MGGHSRRSRKKWDKGGDRGWPCYCTVGRATSRRSVTPNPRVERARLWSDILFIYIRAGEILGSGGTPSPRFVGSKLDNRSTGPYMKRIWYSQSLRAASGVHGVEKRRRDSVSLSTPKVSSTTLLETKAFTATSPITGVQGMPPLHEKPWTWGMHPPNGMDELQWMRLSSIPSPFGQLDFTW